MRQTPPPHQPSAHQRGLGRAHRSQRSSLLARMTDGSPCPCDDTCGQACPCRPHRAATGHGLPRYRDPRRNVDGMPLEADHTLARSQGGTRADRLLLATCNRSRQDGTRTLTIEPEHNVNSRRW